MLYEDLFKNKESLILAIRLKDNGALCGLAEFYGLREHANKISIGNRLLERYWGQGISSETVALMIDYLFNHTEIELITASSMVENIGSKTVLMRNGFILTVHGAEEDWGYTTPTIVDKWFY